VDEGGGSDGRRAAVATELKGSDLSEIAVHHLEELVIGPGDARVDRAKQLFDPFVRRCHHSARRTRPKCYHAGP
jgi:hypothetical protein